ncbi:MAG: polysaccharide ABC transporter ATP-binding protein [Candidatus Microsaccharimonas sp.]
MQKNVAVSVKNVKKNFHLPHEKKSNSIKSGVVNIFKKRNKDADIQHALRGVSFDIHEGEFFGIVGRNGSGKSTLLKLISQIYVPDHGSITVKGKLTPFIELGVGFNPELSGRDNVYLNGALLGFSHAEMEAMYDDIVEFAELDKFMDQKLKNYSSGMQVRLAFSIAIKARADVLLLDEVLAVGDESFQRKCYNYFYEAKRNKKTVIFVTHDMAAVRQFCDRAVLIDNGVVVSEGLPDKIANQYSDLFIDASEREIKKKQKSSDKGAKREKWPVTLHDLNVSQDGKRKDVLSFGEDFSLNLELRSDKVYKNATLGVNFIDQAGRVILATSTKIQDEEFSIHKNTKLSFNIQNVYTDGEYYVNIAIEDEKRDLIYKEAELLYFSVNGVRVSKHSLTHPSIGLEIENN